MCFYCDVIVIPIHIRVIHVIRNDREAITITRRCHLCHVCRLIVCEQSTCMFFLHIFAKSFPLYQKCHITRTSSPSL